MIYCCVYYKINNTTKTRFYLSLFFRRHKMIKVSRIESNFTGNLDFIEQLEFSEEIPYTIMQKKISCPEVVPIHYAPTIEILICSDIDGTVTVGNQPFPVKHSAVFFIPPLVVHSTSFNPAKGGSEGHKIVLTISLEHLCNYVNIEKILQANGNYIDDLPFMLQPSSDFIAVIQDLIRDDGNFSKCICHLLNLFALIVDEKNSSTMHFKLNVNQNHLLQKLINWTYSRIDSKITLEEAAKCINFSKNYFCKYFKETTGMSYVEYLQHIRVSKAASMLLKGASISDCCYECGYTNISYFISIFKKYTGKTMLDYKKTYGLAEKIPELT